MYGIGRQKEEVFQSQKENGTWKIFVDLDFFCPGRAKRRGKFHLQIILCKRVKGRKGAGLRIICPRKREKRRVKQVRSEESRPLSGKENYNRVGFADRLENNSMLPFHATNKNWLLPSTLAAGANRKIAQHRIFGENEL